VHPGWLILWAIGLVTAAITGFYAFRQFALVFLGAPRASEGGHHAHGDSGSIHEPPRVMVWPLIVLAALALCGGFLDVPSFLAPVAPEHGGAVTAEAHGAGGKIVGWVLGGSAGLVGIAAALFLFVSAPATREKLLRDHRLARAFVVASSRKFYIDELYDLLVVKPLYALALVLYYVVDRLLIDGLLVSGSGYVVRGAGSVLRRLQSGHIPAYAMLFLLGTVVLLTLALWAAG
jgi:NADH-quinone oxidoreductase subunit L